jgi:hypothetical protein
VLRAAASEIWTAPTQRCPSARTPARSLAVPVVQSSDGTVVAATGVVVPSLKRDRQRLPGALQVAARGIGHLL